MRRADARSKPHPPRPWFGSRRATNSVEFALIMPVFLMIYFGTIQWGLIVFQRNGAFEAARDACRSAATYEDEDDQAAHATETLTNRLRAYAIDCVTQNFGACELEISYHSGPPDVIHCRVEIDYRSPINFVPSPTNLHATAVAVVEMEQR